jgi:hypothetical protein
MTEGTSATETQGFGLFGGSIPEPGELRLIGVGNANGTDADMWFGDMQRAEVYFSFWSPQRDLILAAAKAMTRLY